MNMQTSINTTPETEAEEHWTYNKLELQGNVSVLTSMTKVNKKARIRKLTKDTYLDDASGEIRECKHHDNRSQNKNSLLRTFATIRGIVNANSEDPESVKFVTLTYKENMTDPKQLYKDFKAFWQRFKRYAKRNGQKRPEYLLVVEPQRRGAWHGHLLMFYGDTRAPYIPKQKLEDIWGLGGVWVQAVNGDMGAYLTAYLTNTVIDADAEDDDDDVREIKGERKAVIKGGRLRMYPTGMNLYRCSRGVKRPEVVFLHEAYAEQWRNENELTYRTERELEDPVTGFETRIRKEWYKDPETQGDGLKTA